MKNSVACTQCCSTNQMHTHDSKNTSNVHRGVQNRHPQHTQFAHSTTHNTHLLCHQLQDAHRPVREFHPRHIVHHAQGPDAATRVPLQDRDHRTEPQPRQPATEEAAARACASPGPADLGLASPPTTLLLHYHCTTTTALLPPLRLLYCTVRCTCAQSHLRLQTTDGVGLFFHRGQWCWHGNPSFNTSTAAPCTHNPSPATYQERGTARGRPWEAGKHWSTAMSRHTTGVSQEG